MKADLAVPGRAQRRRAPAAAILIPALAVLALLAHALAPYHFGGAALRDELAAQLRAIGGLRLTLHHARFTLLPRPRVVAEAVHVADGSATMAIDAEGIIGDVRLLPLLVGRVELSDVALRRPRITLDLAAASAAALLHDTNSAGGAGRPGNATAQRFGSLSIEDGTLHLLRGDAPPLDLAGIDAAIDWTERDASASLDGSLRLDGRRLALALWLETPAALPRGDATAMTLHVHDAGLDLAADGALAAGEAGLAYRGHVSATSSSLAALLARAAPGATLPAPFSDASLDADARVALDGRGPTTIDLQKLALQADGNAWEGTLAYRRGTRPLISATLASNQLQLAPFLGRLPAPLPDGRQWSTAALPPPRIGDVDIDLRISASRLLAPPFAVEDAALAVISKERRIDIALIDGRLAGGALKARASLGGGAGGLDVHVVASLDGASAAALTEQLIGRPLARGPLTATLDLAGGGDSVAALVAGLSGPIGASLGAGDVVDFDGTRTAVTEAALSARLSGGVATIAAARLDGPDLALSGRGMLDLRDRRLDLQAIRSRAGQGAGRSTVDVSGPLDDVTVRLGDAR